MLSLEWAELDIVTTEIERLQSERLSARLKDNAGLMKTLTAELGQALATKEMLVARIVARVSAVAAADDASAQPAAA